MIELYFRQQGMAVNRFVYRDEILRLCSSYIYLIKIISKYFGQIRRVQIMFRNMYWQLLLPKIIGPSKIQLKDCIENNCFKKY